MKMSDRDDSIYTRTRNEILQVMKGIFEQILSFNIVGGNEYSFADY